MSELRSANAALEVTDEGCDIDVGMQEDVPTVGNNPLSHQRSSDSQLVELTLRA